MKTAGRSAVGQPAPGWVYVMRSGDYCKIGFSRQVKTRLGSVRMHNPHGVELVGVVEGTMDDEAAWHRAFLDKRATGEWFRLTDEDVARVLHDSTGIYNLPGDDWIA